MSLVSRLQERLDHRIPGPMPEDGGLVVRLRGREKPDRPEPELAGSRVRLAPAPTLRALRTVKVEPNAPLLMRLVREPYALGVSKGQRVPAGAVRPRHQVDLSRATFSAEVVALHAAHRTVSLMKSAGYHRLAAPPHPFSRSRDNAYLRSEEST